MAIPREIYTKIANCCFDTSIILLGKVGENLATKVIIDASEWQDSNGTFQLLVKRADEEMFTAEISQENGIITWLIHAAEIGAAGYGEIELNYFANDIKMKSARVDTRVFSSIEIDNLTASGTTWSQLVLAAINDAHDAAVSVAQQIVAAEAIAQAAEQSAQSATQKADEAAQSAQEAAQHTAEHISDWLDNHPEATTTVQDGTITRAKLDADLQGKTDAIAAISANLKSLSGSPLPAGYQQIEYIESSGTQSILARSGSHPLNEDSRVVFTFAQTEDGVSATNYLFGARHTTSSKAFYITIGNTGAVCSGFGASGEKNTGARINDTKIHTIDKNKNLVYLDGTLVYTHGAWSGDPAPYNSRVGAIKTATNMSCGRNRIYRYTEYDDGVLAADLIPCKRLSDNVIGMYDLVNESFRTNEGTGVYTAGAAPSLENTNQKVSEIESDLNGVIADVTDIKDSVYGQTYVQEEADRVAAKVRSVQTGKTLTFVAVSDLHYSVYNLSSDPETPALVQAALKDMRDGINGIAGQTHIDFYACFGDVIYQWTSHGANYENGVQEMIGVTKLLNSAFGNNPQVRMVGNHDPNCENSNDKEFSAYELYAFTGIYSDMLEKITPYGGYGHHDFDRQKIRLIVLNTSSYARDEDLTNGTTRYSFGFIQAYRLCGMLDLSEKEDAQDWQIIICSHVALDTSGQTTICKHTSVINAYLTGGTWSGGGYSYDFSGKNAAKLALHMNGHAHTYWFKNLVYRNASGEAQSVTPLANLYVPNALPGREGFSLLSEADGGIEYTKTAGTAESTAFQVITIDPEAKIVYAHHYGAGIDIIMHYDPQAVTAETTLTTDLASPEWYSKDTDVATVSDGIVTPVASGNTMIWCKSDDDNCCEVWNIGVTVT